MNNESHVFENDIERSHKNGIQITYTDRIAPEDYKSDDDEEEVRRKNLRDSDQKKATRIWKNNINQCGYNGMVIQGKWIKPDVRGNVIKQNRKAGIKLTDLGTAHIGGFEKNLDHYDNDRGQRFSLKPHSNLVLSMCTVTKGIVYNPVIRSEEIAVPTA